MSLIILPSELLQIIVGHVSDDIGSLFALSQTNQQFRQFAHAYFRIDAQSTVSSALSWGACRGHLSVLQLALDFGADLDGMYPSQSFRDFDTTILQLACRSYDPSVVPKTITWLLSKGASVDDDTRTCPILEFALEKQNFAAAMAILDTDAAGSSQSLQSLPPASISILTQVPERFYDEFKSLQYSVLERIAYHKPTLLDQLHEDDPPLLTAIQHGDLEIVELLLRLGCDPNITDRCGLTPLMMAVELGKSTHVKSLISAGADVNARFEGQSAIEFSDLKSSSIKSFWPDLLKAGAVIDIDNWHAEGGFKNLYERAISANENGHGLSLTLLNQYATSRNILKLDELRQKFSTPSRNREEEKEGRKENHRGDTAFR